MSYELAEHKPESSHERSVLLAYSGLRDTVEQESSKSYGSERRQVGYHACHDARDLREAGV